MSTPRRLSKPCKRTQQPRANTDDGNITVTLSALKIERPNRSPLFLVDCSLDPNLYSLLHKDWNVELVQY